MLSPEAFLAVSCCALLQVSSTNDANEQIVTVTSLVEVQNNACLDLNRRNWSHLLSDSFNAYHRDLNYKDVAVNGKFNITATANNSLSDRLSHALLVQGSEEALRIVGIVLLTGEVPAIAIPSRHSWFLEGYKLRNVLVPRFGQKLKGFAAVDMVKPPSGAPVRELVSVWNDVRSSPELDAVLQARKEAPGLHLHQYLITEETIQLAFASAEFENETEVIFDSSIIDCSLETFGYVVSAIKPSNTVIHSQHVVIFLHEFYEVAAWSTLSDLLSLTPYVYAFRQRIPVRESKEEPADFTDIYDAVKYDSLRELAAASASVSLTNRSTVCVNVSNFSFAFTVFNEGPDLVRNLKKTCVKGMSGSLGFTHGKGLSSDCLNESLVVFDIMQFTSANPQHGNDPHCPSNWDVVGNWSKTGGLYMHEQLWKLSYVPNAIVARRLLVLVAEFGPFSYQQDTKWKGVDLDLINFIIDYIGNESLSNETEFVKWNGSRDSISRNFIASNNQYDIAIGGIPTNPGKQSIYSRAYFTSSLGIMQRSVNSSSNNRWRFLSPFTWSVWLAVLVIILFSSIVCKWLELSVGYPQSLWFAVSTVFFLQENRLAVMTNPWGRIFFITYSLSLLVLTSTYTANLVSFLSPTSLPPIVRLAELVRRPVVTLESSPYIELLQQSALLEQLETANSIPEAVTSLRNGNVDAFLSETTLLHHILSVSDADCKLSVMRGGLYKQQFAFMLSRNFSSLYGEAVDNAIQNAVTSGTVLNSVRRHLGISSDVHSFKCPNDQLFVESTDEPKRDSSEDVPLDYESMSGIFIISLTAAMLVLVGRAILLLWKRHKRVQVASLLSD